MEVALHRPEAADWPRVAGEVLDEDDRMARLVEELLLLARSDEGRLAPGSTPSDALAVARSVAAADAYATPPLVTVRGPSSPATGPVLVPVPAPYLERIIANLVDNGRRFAASQIEVIVTSAGKSGLIQVRDDGPGVPEVERDRIFERFVRLDEARDRVHGGFGLGSGNRGRSVPSVRGQHRGGRRPPRGGLYRPVPPDHGHIGRPAGTPPGPRKRRRTPDAGAPLSAGADRADPDLVTAGRPGASRERASSPDPGEIDVTDDAAAVVFEAERPRLLGVAYRLVGGRADAEDVVQEAWLRWSAVDRDRIVSPPGWLTTVTTRLALDRLRQVERRREGYVGPWLPDPVSTERSPEEHTELAESLTLGFLVLLDALTPVERAVLLLADVFREPFSVIGSAVGKSEANCRQIAVRARHKVRRLRDAGSSEEPLGGLREGLARGGSSTAVEPATAELLGELMGALISGDEARVVRLLDPDVVLVTDGGAHRHAARRPIVGSYRVDAVSLQPGAAAGTVAGAGRQPQRGPGADHP